MNTFLCVALALWAYDNLQSDGPAWLSIALFAFSAFLGFEAERRAK